MKINNVFIAALGQDIQYYSSLARSLDRSLGNMLEKMAMKIASLNYRVSQHVEGYITTEQTSARASMLEGYKTRVAKPSIADYKKFTHQKLNTEGILSKRHESDYFIFDEQTSRRYLIELKIGGDLDNKKARAEKEALLEQFCILGNSIKSNESITLYFVTAYNRYGEGKEWKQQRVMQFFAPEELLIGKDFWNFICKSVDGYDIVIDEYKKNAHVINDALDKIKRAYLP